MPAPRGVERLLNVIMTIGSRRRITREILFQVIPDYVAAPGVDAAERMFERDKADILALGFPLRTEPDPIEADLVYYRIDAPDQVAPLEVSREEYTVLLAASRAWDDASAGGAARRVRAKLLSLGQEPDPDLARTTPHGSVESLPVLSPLLEAVSSGRSVSFRYRTTRGNLAERTVEPWVVGVVTGHWYLLGHDLDRDAERLFRASRIESFPRLRIARRHPVPPDVDLAATVARAEGDPDDHGAARLHLEPFKALALRRSVGADLEATRIDLPATDRRAARRAVLAESRWATLLSPVSWREELAVVLEQIAQAHRDAPAVDLGDLLSTSSPRTAPTIPVRPSGTDHLS
ncbi:MAG: WYL domain-containing protein, partial [Brachybacterium sp.]|nr:WYL domain-containing protein [Brachybacterium sp.]